MLTYFDCIPVSANGQKRAHNLKIFKIPGEVEKSILQFRDVSNCLLRDRD
jgi:hypothetical protein